MCEAEEGGIVAGSVLAEGKTKIITATGQVAIGEFHLKDILTAGDGERKESFEGIGSLKNTAVCNIFSFLRSRGVKNHFLEKYRGNSFRASLCEMIPLEVVVRRSVPPRSSYLKRNPGVKENTIFTDPVVEFFYKDDIHHDPYVYTGAGGEWMLFDARKPIFEGEQIGCVPALLTRMELAIVRNTAQKAFVSLEEAFADQRLVLHDFKVEFGKVSERILLADTLCLDEMRLTEGKDGKVLDKDVFRAGGDPEEIMRNYAHVAAVTERFFDIVGEE